MEHHTGAVSSHRTDWPMFITTVLVIPMLSVPMGAFKDQATVAARSVLECDAKPPGSAAAP